MWNGWGNLGDFYQFSSLIEIWTYCWRLCRPNFGAQKLSYSSTSCSTIVLGGTTFGNMWNGWGDLLQVNCIFFPFLIEIWAYCRRLCRPNFGAQKLSYSSTSSSTIVLGGTTLGTMWNGWGNLGDFYQFSSLIEIWTYCWRLCRPNFGAPKLSYSSTSCSTIVLGGTTFANRWNGWENLLPLKCIFSSLRWFFFLIFNRNLAYWRWLCRPIMAKKCILYHLCIKCFFII